MYGLSCVRPEGAGPERSGPDRVQAGSPCCSGNQCTAILRRSRMRVWTRSQGCIPQVSSFFLRHGRTGQNGSPRGSPIDETCDASLELRKQTIAGSRIAWAAPPVIPGIQYAASNCSARGQDQTSMILTEEIEQTKASDTRPGDSTRRWIGVRIY